MTSPTGIWTGLIAVTLLLASVIHKRSVLLALSLGVFMLAFSIRAGAYFIIPALFLAGLWAARKNRKSLFYFLAVTVLAVGLSMTIPRIINHAYGTRGGVYQGNYIYVLYMLSVGSRDWRQITRDFPHSRDELRPESKWVEFAKSKTLEAFVSNPSKLFITCADILHNAIKTLPHSYFLSIIRPSIDNASLGAFAGHKTIFNFIFYSGLLFLLAGTALNKSARMGLLLLLIGYTLSLPFIWLGPSIRFQAVTYFIPSLAIAGVLSRQGNLTPPFSIKFPYAACLLIYAWFIAVIFMPFLFKYVFPFNMGKLSIKILSGDKKRSYILAGPNMISLRFKEDNNRHVRPDISINEFRNLKTMQYESRKKRFEPYKAGEQLTMTVDINYKNAKMYISKPFCIPDKLWVYQVVISRHAPPYTYRLTDIKPVDYEGRPLAMNKPLPFHCM